MWVVSSCDVVDPLFDLLCLTLDDAKTVPRIVLDALVVITFAEVPPKGHGCRLDQLRETLLAATRHSRCDLVNHQAHRGIYALLFLNQDVLMVYIRGTLHQVWLAKINFTPKAL